MEIYHEWKCVYLYIYIEKFTTKRFLIIQKIIVTLRWDLRVKAESKIINHLTKKTN
jgi:hypothetical protein